MSDPPDGDSGSLIRRGVLYPTRLPTFTRVDPPERVAELVRWFWIPEWNIAPGRTSRQHVIAFAASNLVVEGDSVNLFGPTSRVSHRDLSGAGWAVGALLRPGALPAFSVNPAALRDTSVSLDVPELHAAVNGAMSTTLDQAERHRRAVDAFATWLIERVGNLGDDARLANSLVDLMETDQRILRLSDVTTRLGVSARTAQRLCRRFVGVPPGALIRRRRLQEAADVVRRSPRLDLAEVAAQLGYADHAHLTRDFRAVLGFTPSDYRSAVSG